jgi:alkanesulfonate monooxygenase SsuD/methylene tetrahydromethanopterin reductase-like flavin-dependent oxidoreductase (luciferase family)
MKASMLCGAHYEGAEAHFHRAPVSPTQCDPDIARQSFDHFLDYAALADEVGYDWVSVSEHHYSPLILAPSVAPLAGALTQIVRRAKIALLGPLVSINNPVRIAEEIAMLDQLSHGRLVVLPLRGTPGEFNTYEPLDASITQAKTQEATKLIRQALRDVEPFSWDSEFFHFPKVGIWPRALQRPFPPMYFSGNSLNSAVFAAREHLGVCLSFHRPEVVARTVATYRSEALSAGWEPSSEQVVYRGFALVADTDERAAEAGPTPFGMGRMLFVGSPDTVVERVRAFHAATGVGVVDLVFSSGQISPGDVQRSIELFGREVLPRIRDLGVAQDMAGAAQVGAENHDPGRHR